MTSIPTGNRLPFATRVMVFVSKPIPMLSVNAARKRSGLVQWWPFDEMPFPPDISSQGSPDGHAITVAIQGGASRTRSRHLSVPEASMRKTSPSSGYVPALFAESSSEPAPSEATMVRPLSVVETFEAVIAPLFASTK